MLKVKVYSWVLRYTYKVSNKEQIEKKLYKINQSVIY